MSTTATTNTPHKPAHTPLTERLSDRFHPVLIKELRQATRSGILPVSLIAVLAAQVVTLGMAVSSAAGPSLSIEAGRNALAWSTFTLLVITVMVIPAAVAARLSSEKAEHQTSMVAITPIGAPSLLTGKIKTAMLLELIVFSATLPFMVLTYLLRGVDMITIFSVSIVNAFAVLLAVTFAISVAALATHPLARAFAAVVILAGLVVALVFAAVVSSTLITTPEDARRLGDLTRFIFLCLLTAGFLVFFLFGTALVALSPDRYHRPQDKLHPLSSQKPVTAHNHKQTKRNKPIAT